MDRAPVFGTGGCRFDSCRVHTGNSKTFMYTSSTCGYGSGVEHLLAKEESRVRVPVPAQIDKIRIIGPEGAHFKGGIDYKNSASRPKGEVESLYPHQICIEQ